MCQSNLKSDSVKNDMVGRDYKLIYYDIRGLAEPIRWMFRIANVEFEDLRIPLENWEEEKKRFTKQAGKFPILVMDGNKELSQAHSIMRFLAKQLGFNGKTEMETTIADEVVEILYDMRLCPIAHKQFFTCKTPDIVHHTVFHDIANEKSLSKKVLLKKILLEDDFPKYLHKINAFLEKSEGPYLAGDNMTYADLAFTNLIDICEVTINPDLLSDYPDLADLKEEVLDIPAIKEWMATKEGKNLEYPLELPTAAA